ncbi:MAG: FAD-binding oxidoreductase [Patescibacteria group bacterium]|nr:FAD-binding oxidoreductase [Patescibacteria group bacterium]MDE1940967.1 FAD-binding oxidoreductase [Patescibacteria group bacterium]MDE1966921.1 FAD-binding oxidoreductase [Patescibacteria group bacterium]
MSIQDDLSKLVKGDVDASDEALAAASHDASLFEVRPQAVVSPKDADDVKALVKYADAHPGVSLTARSAGTDMGGGPLTESVVVSFTKYFNHIKEVSDGFAVTEPGVYYRDFDKATLEKGGQILPSYPASRELCTVGGMVANNSGGEKTLTYGKTERYIRRLKMVCADGEEHEFKPLGEQEARRKEEGAGFEAEVYGKMRALIDSNRDLLAKAKPIVSKNSCGYYLWNVEHDGLFDLCRMIVGSQGTLGMVTEIEFGLVKPKTHSHLLVVFLNSLDQLGETATHILEYKPESFESYDDQTLKVAIKFLPQLMKQMGGNVITLGLEFVPEMLAVLESARLPKLVLMAEFTADTDEEALKAAMDAQMSLKAFHEKTRVTKTESDEHKYWVIRRESFNMLRKHVHGVRTAPFIDDFVVPPMSLPRFLPRLYEVLDPYKKELTYTIAGHVGDGNFHIIPLMNLNDHERAHQIIKDLSVKVYELVHEFHGSITGEHNDGIIRTPFIKMQYGEEVYRLFEEVKKIWDPKGIFNPGKKVGGTLDYAFAHLVKSS